MLTIHQLKVFVTVTEAGSVRAAAERLVVTQPAVSASLAALEREVGAVLFGRSGRGIELTEAGRVMVRYASLILGLVDETLSAVGEVDDPGRGTVRVAAVTSAEHLVAPALARVRSAVPGLGITLEIGNRNRIWQLLADRTVDIAVAGRPPATGEIATLATRPNELVLVGKPGAVWPHLIGEITWLLREPGSGIRAATEEVIASLGISPPTLTVASNGAIQAAAETGLGVALLPRDTVEASLRQRSLVPIHAGSTPLQRPWHVLARAGDELPAPARRLLDDLVHHSGFTPAT